MDRASYRSMHGLHFTFLTFLSTLISFPAYGEPVTDYNKFDYGGRKMSGVDLRGPSKAPFVIGLLHRDFIDPNLEGVVEKMKSAVNRSKRRLENFEKGLKVVSSEGHYKAPVRLCDGAYTTPLTIGTPSSTFSAIVDTGSDLIWLQCKPCENCYSQFGPIFDPSNSSTYKKASCDSLCEAVPQHQCSPTCQYTYNYGDFSYTKGDFSYDTLTFTDTSGKSEFVPHIGIGCGHDNQGGGFDNADGLVGLGQGPLSLVSQLSLEEFSYCLVSLRDSSSQTSPMYLGSSSSVPGSNVQTTPIITNPSFTTYYYLQLIGISIDGHHINIPSGAFNMQADGSGGLIIDSGTTITYLIDEVYQLVLNAFRSAIQLPIADGSRIGLDLCYKKTGRVPRLSFHFDGADLNLPPENYFIDFQGLFCLAIGSSSDVSILGNIQQQNYQIVYNLTNKKLSFTRTKCDLL
eukprot:c25063_g1_i1 orf=356-1729(-)